MIQYQTVTGKPDTPESLAVDLDLVTRLQALCPVAFERLVDIFEKPLYQFFYYSHGDHDRALDDCAETFVALVSAIGKMRGDGESLRAFVYGVARNVQRRGWRQKQLVGVGAEELERVADPGLSAFESLEKRQQFEKALDLIREFGDPERQVMLLRFVEELRLEEIAAVLEVPLNTVKSHLHRSCKRLRDKLEQ